MKPSILKLSLIVVVFLSQGIRSNGQPVPDEFKKGTISEQLNQLETHTKIYENYRAIREDIFQLTSRNIKDTLAMKTGKINNLNAEVVNLKVRLDSLSKGLETTKSNLDEMIRTKNNIRVLGVGLNKNVYNSAMWSILSIVLLLLVIGFLIFKSNRSTTLKTNKELTELKNQFEEYKQKKRIEIETLTMSHFNEIKKLKNDPSKR
jgi:hypothetical protein